MAATTPAQIDYIRLVALRGALRLEMRGMRMSRGASALSVAKRQGYTGNRATILSKVEEDIEAHPANPNK